VGWGKRKALDQLLELDITIGATRFKPETYPLSVKRDHSTINFMLSIPQTGLEPGIWSQTTQLPRLL
jgi:hypothetical protein